MQKGTSPEPNIPLSDERLFTGACSLEIIASLLPNCSVILVIFLPVSSSKQEKFMQNGNVSHVFYSIAI